MGYEHFQLVLDHSQTRGPARAILLVLAHRMNLQGECWPALGRIAREAGVDRRTVLRVLPKIENLGELLVESRSRTSSTRGGRQAVNLYRLTITPPKGGDRQSLPSCGKGGTDGPQGRDRQSAKVGTDSPKGRDPRSPESKENGKSEPTTNQDWLHEFSEPVQNAMKITGEKSPQALRHWQRRLNEATRKLGPASAKRNFQAVLVDFSAKMKDGNVRNPGGLFTTMLKQLLYRAPVEQW